MVRLLNLSALVAFLTFAALPGSANAGVITGDWTVVGDASFDGDGSATIHARGLNAVQFASELGIDVSGHNINHASAITKSLTVDQGSSISFDWEFFTDETAGHGTFREDFAFWSLTADGPAIAPQVSVSSSDFNGGGSFTGLSGNYTLTFGVANVGTNANLSTLVISNLQLSNLELGNLKLDDPTVSTTMVNPEPASLAIWGLGALGLAVGAARRRRRRAVTQAA